MEWSTSVKPQTPCLNACLPVAMEVQSIGESIGRRLARLPITPALMTFSRTGSSPLSNNGWMIFQSAESQPTSKTFRLDAGRLTMRLT